MVHPILESWDQMQSERKWAGGLRIPHRQATATYAQLGVCSNYFSIPLIEYFLANFNFYNNMEFNPSSTHSKLYKYTV